MTVKVENPGYGWYFANGTYTTSYSNNYTVSTGILIFNHTNNVGPFYVSPDGDDDNDGSKDHPFKSIQLAITAASKSENNSAVYIYNGTYNEGVLNIKNPINITGLGNVILNGENNHSIFNISGSNVNISNIVLVAVLD